MQSGKKVNRRTAEQRELQQIVLSGVQAGHVNIAEEISYNYKIKFATPSKIDLSQEELTQLAEQFKKALVDFYKQDEISKVTRLFKSKASPINIEDCFVNLCIIQQRKFKEEKEILYENRQRETIRDARIHNYETLHNVEHTKLIKPEALFAEQDSADGTPAKPINRVVAIGRAGIGKSTLCRYLIHQWATGLLWKTEGVQSRFDVVVWIPLRELSHYAAKADTRGQDPSIAGFLCRQGVLNKFFEEMGLSEQKIKQLLLQLKDRICYIIDGFDEIARLPEKHPVWTLIKILKMEQSLITSRPCDSLPPADRELEVMGFLDDDIPSYVDSYFKSNGGDVEKGKQLIEHLDKNKSVWGIAHIPINLELICFVWQQDYKGQPIHMQDITMTSLYKKLSDHFLTNYLNDEERGYPRYLTDKPKHSSGMLLPAEFVPVIKTIGAIALRGLITQELIISPELIKEVCGLYKQDILAVIEVGLLKGAGDNIDVENDHYFLHLTFQEYYAALYIVSVFLKETEWRLSDCGRDSHSSKDNLDYQDVEAFIQRYKYDERYEIVWWFVSGLLADKGQEHTKRFFDLLDTPPVDFIGVHHAILFIRLLEECISQKGKKRLAYLNCTGRFNKAVDYTQRIIVMKKDTDYFYQKGHPFYEAYQALIRSLVLSPHFLNDESFVDWVESTVKQGNVRVIQFCSDLGRQSISLPPKIISALIGALPDKDSDVRRAAADALGKQTALSEDTVSALIRALPDKDSDVRRAAADALGKQTALSEDTVSILIRALEDEDSDVRHIVAYALGRQNALSEAPISALIKALKDDEDSDVRRAAADALGKQTALSEDTVSILIRALRDEDSDVRHAAAYALGKHTALSEDTVSALITALPEDSDVRRAVIDALGNQTALSRNTVSTLIRALRDEDSGVRRAAAYALGKQKLSPDTISVLITALDDGDDYGHRIVPAWDPYVKRTAAYALGRQNTLSPDTVSARALMAPICFDGENFIIYKGNRKEPARIQKISIFLKALQESKEKCGLTIEKKDTEEKQSPSSPPSSNASAFFHSPVNKSEEKEPEIKQSRRSACILS